MAGSTHHYAVTVTWTGNRGEGTQSYRSYSRDHEIGAEGRPSIAASSEPDFRGDPGRWNPEQLLVASLSQCHLLWYLHLCSTTGVVVITYKDTPDGVMEQTEDGGGHFTEVTLRPVVTIEAGSPRDKALELHDRAHELCFIANSVNFPVRHEPMVRLADSR